MLSESHAAAISWYNKLRIKRKRILAHDLFAVAGHYQRPYNTINNREIEILYNEHIKINQSKSWRNSQH